MHPSSACSLLPTDELPAAIISPVCRSMPVSTFTESISTVAPPTFRLIDGRM